MKTQRLAVILGSFCLALLLAVPLFTSACAKTATTPATTVKPIEMKAQPLHTGSQLALQDWASRVAEQSGGRLQVTVYPAETFAKMPDLPDALRDGLVDVSNLQVLLSPGRFPRYDVGDLPLSPWAEDTEAKVYIIQKMLDEGYIADDFKDYKMLWFSPTSVEVPQTKVPIRKLEDWKGLRIRHFGVLPMKGLEALGATPVLMGVYDVYLALEKGILDGLVHPIAEIPNFKWHEVTKYTTNIGHIAMTFPTGMNLKEWEALPADLKKVVEGNIGMSQSMRSKEIFDTMYAAPNEEWVRLKLPDRVIELSPAEKERWRTAVRPVWDQWVADMEGKGLPGKKLYDAVFSCYEDYKKEYSK